MHSHSRICGTTVQLACVAQPSVIASCFCTDWFARLRIVTVRRSLGRKSDPVFFRHLHRPKFTELSVHVREKSQFATPFSVWRFCSIPETFAINSRCYRKSRQNFDAFGPPVLGRGLEGLRNFWPKSINLGQQRRTCGKIWWWHQVTAEIRQRKAEINISNKT